MAVQKPRRTAGSRPIGEYLRSYFGSKGALVDPPTDPDCDVAAFEAGEQLVMRGWPKAGSRVRYGVLILNGSGPGSITWHRGILRRYAASGKPLRPPIELEEYRPRIDAPSWRSRPAFVEVRLRVAGEPLTLWMHFWDLPVFCAATGIVPRFDDGGDEDRGGPAA